MRSFSFIHAADLHLDSPFKGLTVESVEMARLIRAATFDAWRNVVRLAIDRGVDFVVIAGDVYDGEDRSLRAQLAFRDGLADLAAAGIPSYVVHGNHDSLRGWSSAIRWPHGVHIFGEELETVIARVDGEPVATISGISYATRHETRNLAAAFGRPGRDLFNIGLLHANVGSETGHAAYAPCELAELIDGGMDYWALGHVHTHSILWRRPHVAYPGNTQGRHMREQGPRGCLLVSVDEYRRVETELLAVDAVRWAFIDVDIAALDSIDAVDEKALQAVYETIAAADGRPLVCTVRLRGNTSLHADLARSEACTQLLERIRQQFEDEPTRIWIQEVVIDTLPEIDFVERALANDVIGDVLRMSSALAADGEALTAWMTAALDPLQGRCVDERILAEQSPDELRRLLDDARLLCINRLESAR